MSPSSPSPVPSAQPYDIVVYGGTAAAITAVLEAQRSGLRAVLVSPDRHLGGMTSGGLGWTDSKDGRAIGGLAREFFHRVWKHYRQPEAWTRVEREAYAARVHAQPGKTIDDEEEVMWTFEPHVAEKIFDTWLEECGVEVHRNEWLDRKNGVTLANQRITAIRCLSGKSYSAKAFIDATYEGDLMAAAGVTYRVGRDSSEEFGESLNGVYFKKPGMRYYQDDAYQGISPYVVPGDPQSGFIQGIEGEMPSHEKVGDADTRLQSFNLRLCLTDQAENRVPIERPANYQESDYELLLRLYDAGKSSGFSTLEMPNGKTDSNNLGFFSLDYVGGNFSHQEGWNYSEASYAERERIIADHVHYTQGLLWTIMNHPRVPEEQRREWSRWGLAADEFTDSGHWPFQLYVREARRMSGLDLVTQHHVEMKPGYEVADSIGLGSYSLDSHNVRRVVIEGKIAAEGGFYVYHDLPYPISYGSIVPRRGEIENLLVPVTLSATHAAFGSIRMEPTYMILGQSAAAAACLAVKENISVQDVSYSSLQARLQSGGQVLDVPPPKIRA